MTLKSTESNTKSKKSNTKSKKSNTNSSIKTERPTKQDLLTVSRIILLLIALALLSTFFVVVNAGERGVVMQFGRVEEQVLEEGIHFIIPLVNTVEKLSVRVQGQEISAEASSKDLQNVFTDVDLNWHIIPEKANLIFQQIGDRQAIITHIINPAVEEVVKAIMAQYTAEEIITKRGDVKAGVDGLLTSRLSPYHITVDDISLVRVRFSERFSEAVEAKQIAEQEAKRAGFTVIKAAREAEIRINLARGEAEAQRLIRSTLTPDLIRKQTVEKWDGKLPLMMESDRAGLLEVDLDDLLKTRQK